jgi:hypothetical protein
VLKTAVFAPIPSEGDDRDASETGLLRSCRSRIEDLEVVLSCFVLARSAAPPRNRPFTVRQLPQTVLHKDDSPSM